MVGDDSARGGSITLGRVLGAGVSDGSELDGVAFRIVRRRVAGCGCSGCDWLDEITSQMVVVLGRRRSRFALGGWAVGEALSELCALWPSSPDLGDRDSERHKVTITAAGTWRCVGDCSASGPAPSGAGKDMVARPPLPGAVTEGETRQECD